jgi:carbamoylphosphate synthase large subunit
MREEQMSVAFLPQTASPIYRPPEYASAVTLPRISSESVKKMALAQRKKAF